MTKYDFNPMPFQGLDIVLGFSEKSKFKYVKAYYEWKTRVHKYTSIECEYLLHFIKMRCYGLKIYEK